MTAVFPEKEMQPAAARPRRRRRVALLLAPLVVAAVAFGAGFAVGGADEPPAPEGLAPAEMVEVIDGELAAFNSGDMERMGSYFSADAVFSEPGAGGSNRPVQGRAEIIRIMKGLYGMGAQYNRIGPVTYTDRLASFPVSGPGGTEIDVVKFNDDLQITHYWILN